MRTLARRAGFDDAERRERTEVAVEVAAARNRVDVRAEEDRRQRRLEPVAAREDVAGGIDARFEARRAHQADDVRPAGDVRVGIRHAAHAVGERAAGGPAELAQLLEPRAQRRRVDFQIWCRSGQLRRGRPRPGRLQTIRPSGAAVRAPTNARRVASMTPRSYTRATDMKGINLR